MGNLDPAFYLPDPPECFTCSLSVNATRGQESRGFPSLQTRKWRHRGAQGTPPRPQGFRSRLPGNGRPEANGPSRHLTRDEGPRAGLTLFCSFSPARLPAPPPPAQDRGLPPVPLGLRLRPGRDASKVML